MLHASRLRPLQLRASSPDPECVHAGVALGHRLVGLRAPSTQRRRPPQTGASVTSPANGPAQRLSGALSSAMLRTCHMEQRGNYGCGAVPATGSISQNDGGGPSRKILSKRNGWSFGTCGPPGGAGAKPTHSPGSRDQPKEPGRARPGSFRGGSPSWRTLAARNVRRPLRTTSSARPSGCPRRTGRSRRQRGSRGSPSRHRWGNQYGGMKANDAKRLKEFERERRAWCRRGSSGWLSASSSPQQGTRIYWPGTVSTLQCGRGTCGSGTCGSGTCGSGTCGSGTCGSGTCVHGAGPPSAQVADASGVVAVAPAIVVEGDLRWTDRRRCAAYVFPGFGHPDVAGGTQSFDC